MAIFLLTLALSSIVFMIGFFMGERVEKARHKEALTQVTERLRGLVDRLS